MNNPHFKKIYPNAIYIDPNQFVGLKDVDLIRVVRYTSSQELPLPIALDDIEISMTIKECNQQPKQVLLHYIGEDITTPNEKHVNWHYATVPIHFMNQTPQIPPKSELLKYWYQHFESQLMVHYIGISTIEAHMIIELSAKEKLVGDINGFY